MDLDVLQGHRPAPPSDAAARRQPEDFRAPGGARLLLSDIEKAWQAATRATSLERRLRLGEVLMGNGVISPAQLHLALAEQRAETQSGSHRPLGQIMLAHGFITAADLQVALAAAIGMPLVDCAAVRPQREALALVPLEIAQNIGVLPIRHRKDTLLVAVDDPWRKSTIDELRFLTNQHVIPVMAMPGTLEPGIALAYERLQQHAHAEQGSHIEALAQALAHDMPEAASNSPDVITESSNALVRLVHHMIEDAVQRGASDIHIDFAPQQDLLRIRFRIDGILVSYLELPPHYHHALVSRIKIMADIDIAEHRKPQDGKIDFARFGGTAKELRVVTVPTHHGLEYVVLRLLAGAQPLPVQELGLTEHNLTALRSSCAKPYGLILICGPTGCGKTTTLHSVLHELNDGERKIWTAEDPIEITQDGLCQVQVNARIGWTFAAAMRTFLRADPDVIMVGEMRDEETARIAIEASLTGHLVLSTLHTNSAAESVARLLEMGIDPFNFSDSLLAVLAQRLVRRLCPHCSGSTLARDHEVEAMLYEYQRSAHDQGRAVDTGQLLVGWRAQYGDEQGRLSLRRKAGCDACNGRGYKGRLGIHELLLADDLVREQIRHRAAAADILQSGLKAGMHTLRQDGIVKVLQGHTDMGEVIAASNL
jgi:type II secretory ATPase GspE/PulE/Tfp pilus assembly ATPase PilB-like protein